MGNLHARAGEKHIRREAGRTNLVHSAQAAPYEKKPVRPAVVLGGLEGESYDAWKVSWRGSQGGSGAESAYGIEVLSDPCFHLQAYLAIVRLTKLANMAICCA